MQDQLIRNARMAVEVVRHELVHGRSTTKAQRAELVDQLENAITYLSTALQKEPSS